MKFTLNIKKKLVAILSYKLFCMTGHILHPVRVNHLVAFET